MENEIIELKRILNILKKHDALADEDDTYLYNYITNLQEENERLKTEVDLLEDNRNYLNNKIEKAIEYIKENCIDDEFYINLTNKEKNIIKVLDILNGGDDNE